MQHKADNLCHEEHRKLAAEAEAFLKTLTEEERTVLFEHAASFCTLDGRHLPHMAEKDNLFDTVSQMERYIVDTNSNWKAEAAKPENRDKAFIIGKTLTDEQDDIRGLFFGPNVRIHNGNIFVLSMFHPSNDQIEHAVMLERLDKHYRNVFDEQSLLNASRPRSEKERLRDPKFLEYEHDYRAGVDHERKVILLLLDKIHNISELRPPDELQEKRSQFLAFIQKESPRCSGDYVRSAGVARHCYALLLMEKAKMRTEFARPGYYNVFGDTRIIQNALFMQAAILSGDKALKRMASYAGLNCVQQIHNRI